MENLNNPVEEVVSNVVNKISFRKQFWNKLKKLLLLLLLFKWLFQFLKWWANNIRKAVKIQVDDTTWGTVIWIKIWRLLYGVIGGVLLEYYFNVFTNAKDWIFNIANVII